MYRVVGEEEGEVQISGQIYWSLARCESLYLSKQFWANGFSLVDHG